MNEQCIILFTELYRGQGDKRLPVDIEELSRILNHLATIQIQITSDHERREG